MHAVLSDRGISGGSMIFHGYSRGKECLPWKPHYHFLGFVEGGYTCRGCKHKSNCIEGCSGFDAKAWAGFQSDGYYVKVFSERRKSYYSDKPNVFGTALYQCGHATVQIGIKRSHVVTWFGVCGNRKYGTPKVVSKVTCPLCSGDMVRSVFVGKRRIVKDVGDPDYVPIWLYDEFDEFGAPNFIDKE